MSGESMIRIGSLYGDNNRELVGMMSY